MSTERKPGSRGGLNPFDRSIAKSAPSHGNDTGSRDNQKTKGSTKVSPRKGFKKKPRK